MTHDELVMSAFRWVKKNGECGVVFRELGCIAGEIPDVIGFGCDDHSVLVECKASRADFLSDKNKPFRREPERGMGKFRLYCTPRGMIGQHELPPKWGLLEVGKGGKAIATKNTIRLDFLAYFGDGERQYHARNEYAERAILYSALRRLEIRRRIEEIYIIEKNVA